MTTETTQIKNRSVTLWQAGITLIPIFFVLIGVGFTYASGVDQNTSDVKEIKVDVKELQDVKVDINKLNVSNARLQNEVKHINMSQQRTETQINETNDLLKKLIEESRQKPEPAYERRGYRRYPGW